MGRAPCCEKIGLKQGKWTNEEDEILTNYIKAHGEGSWRSLPKKAGLLRCGKSCRLRWINYLRAGIKRGNFSREEDELIIKLHSSLGNRWSQIARELPGRTDNEIKNYWNSHLSRSILPTSDESIETLTTSHETSQKNCSKMAQPTKKTRKKIMVVDEVINPQTSLKNCNEAVESEFSSLSDEELCNNNHVAFSGPLSPILSNNNAKYWRLEPSKSSTEYSCITNEPSTSKEEIRNWPSSPDLNSIFKEIDSLLNSEIEETNIEHGGHNNMPSDTQNDNPFVQKEVGIQEEGLFGDLGCLDSLWDLDLWSSMSSTDDKSLQHIIVESSCSQGDFEFTFSF